MLDLDFKIRRGLATDLFTVDSDGNINYLKANPLAVLEYGTWYLCIDTAELFLCVQENNTLCLKRINDKKIADLPTTTPDDQPGADLAKEVLGAYVDNNSGEFYLVFSDGTEQSLGNILSDYGKDALGTTILIDNTFYEASNGIITLPDFVTRTEVPTKLSQLVNDKNYITSIPSEYITEAELAVKAYATEFYVNKKIESIPEPDLTSYAKKTDIPDVTLYAKKVELPNFELFAKKTDIPDLTPYLKEVPAEFITEAELNNKGYLTEHQSLEAYAKKTDIPDISKFITSVPDEYITEAELVAKGYLTEHQSLANYATKTFVENTVAENQPNLTKYALKTDIPEVPSKVSDLENDANYITLEQVPTTDLSNYYNKTETEGLINTKADVEHIHSYTDLNNLPEIPSIEGLASEDFVRSAIGEIPLADKADKEHTHDTLYDAKGAAEAVKNELLNGAGEAYDTLKELGAAIESNKDVIAVLQETATGKADANHTHEEFDSKADKNHKHILTDISDFEGYAKISYVDEQIAAIPTPDLTDYAKTAWVTNEINKIDFTKYALKTDVPSIEGLATENFVNEAVSTVVVPTKVSELADDIGFAVKADLTGLATESWVINKIAEATLADKDVDLTGLATTDELNALSCIVEALPDKRYVDEAISAIPAPDYTGLATETFVEEKIAAIEFPETDLTDYAKKSELPSVDGLASETWVEAQGYLKEHQSLNDYYNKSEVDALIPSIEGFIKMADVEAKGYITDVSDKANKSDFEALSTELNITIAGKASIDHKHTLTDISDYQTPDLTPFITKDELESKGYITDVSDKASTDHKHDDLYEAKGAVQQLKNELLNGAGDAYDTLKELGDLIIAEDTAIKALETIATGKADKEHTHPDKADVEHKHTLADITDYVAPSFEGYATEESVDKKIAAIPLVDYALKSEIPNIEGLATEEFVAEQISAIPATDLSKYATIEYVEAEIAATDTKNREEAIAAFASKDDIKDFITLETVNEQGFLKEHQSLEDYAKKSDLPVVPTKVSELENDANYLTEHQSLEAYATKEEVTTTLASYAEKSALVGFASEEYVKTEIAKAQLDDKEVDLTGYAKESFVTDEIKKAVDNVVIPEIPTNVSAFTNDAGYITLADVPEADLSGKADVEHTHAEYANVDHTHENVYAAKEHEHTQYLTEHQSLEDYAKKSDLPDMATKADKEHSHSEYLTEHQDISGKADVDHKHDDLYEAKGAAEAIKNELLDGAGEAYDTLKELGALIETNKDALKALQEIATGKADKEHTHAEYALSKDLAELATKTEIPTTTSQLTNDSGYITAEELPTDYLVAEDLAEYAKSEAITDMATKTWVAAQGYITNVDGKADVEHSHKEYLTAEALVGYSKFSGSYNDLSDKPVIPSIEGLATTEYVDNAVSVIENKADKDHKHDEYLTEHQDISGKADKEHTHSEYALIEALNSFATKSEIPTLTSQLTNDSSYITADQLPTDYLVESDLAGYAKKADIPDVSDFITEIPAEYITETELNSKGYLTEHQSLEGLATQAYVDDVITNINIPSLDDYSTTEEVTNIITATVEDLAAEIPFTSDYFVTKPIGNFIAGDNVNGMTISEILAKLLGLTNHFEPAEPDKPGEPANPEDFDNIVEKIETMNIPMYSINSEGELITTSFRLIDSTAEPTESGFYAVKDTEGNIIEAGYQDITVENDEMCYMIALPKEIDYNEMIDLYSWDPDEKVWVSSELDLTNDPDFVNDLCSDLEVDISHINTDIYTVWVVEELCTGSILRYKFKDSVFKEDIA